LLVGQAFRVINIIDLSLLASEQGDNRRQVETPGWKKKK